MTDLRSTAVSDSSVCWPALPLSAWQDTRDTLHMWTQIVGKVRLALTPKTNHWWNVALYVTARGLTTSAIPYGDRVFEIEFDFLEHQLIIKTCDPATKIIPLGPRSRGRFLPGVYGGTAGAQDRCDDLAYAGRDRQSIPFDQDKTHASYDKNMRAASGARWSQWTTCSRSFVRALSASPARYISSGAALTWP